MPIAWRDKLSVGNDQIDTDHKYLICLFNSIELSLRCENSQQMLPLFVSQLFDYTKEHFSREELLQKKIGFADFEQHHLKHQAILDHLHRINLELKSLGNSDNLSKQELDKLTANFDKDLLGLAREWIVDHIVKEDIKMTSYLSRYPSNYS